MDVKSSYEHGKMSDLNKELGKVDYKLMTLLQKYDLHDAVLAFKEKMKHRNEFQMTEDNLPLPSEKFEDERLQKLWNAAQNQQFTDSELRELHAELKEAERKTDHYNDLMDELKKVPHENHVDHDPEAIDALNKRAKTANREMNDHLDELHNTVHSTDKSPFKSDKVKKLWKLAQANKKFTAKDLEILKEELMNFDKQLGKAEFHKKELDRFREQKEAGGKNIVEDSEHISDFEERHEKLDKKVRKMEKYLQHKVKHTEL
ncbi:hypothetical protein WR25_12481 [Diploscapter pachys]|uniref:Alpha-2-macroglobulin RAP C-terminal domain-containing protein n=1 Tax=Diploscapter pachys TaxID=2018661 RepID=A0A2A2KDB7_9BILA|nr:hypothetical protein WR25_12481 [Diploscapter pachys]